MKFLVLCTFILSIAFFMASVQANEHEHPPKGDTQANPAPQHHHAVRSAPFSADDQLPPKGEAGCCG